MKKLWGMKIMPNWHSVLNELQQMGSPFDILRRKYIKNFSDITGRNVICYYSGWLQKRGIEEVSVNDSDKNGLMTVINELDVSKGLDLILHTPGGETAATESIVDYLYKKFGNDIRCFVPQMAMSAGTMIACACKEIWMGKESSLGPIDPQYRGLPAHAILEEFNRAVTEIKSDPAMIPIWQPIIAKYSPTLLGECDKAIKWSTTMVKDWLARNMLSNNSNKTTVIDNILQELGDHAVNLAHNRHLSAEKCKSIGLIIKELELDQNIQDAVLSIHHIYFHTLSVTPAFKIIENHQGIAFIQQAQTLMMPQNMNMGMMPMGFPQDGQLTINPK
jgi:ClpP class serine protease